MQKKPSTDAQTHRSSGFKQQNKAHKHGRHKSKGELMNQNKGKISIKATTKGFKKQLNKQGRRNQIFQVRQNKREEAIAKKRKLGSFSSPPFLVTVIPLCPYVDAKVIIDYIRNCDEELEITESRTGNVHISCKRFKQRFTFVLPSMDNYLSCLDAAKVSDTLLLVHPLEEESEMSDSLLSILFAQGLPSTVHVSHGLDDVPAKKRNSVKKLAQKNLERNFPDEKLQIVDSNADALLVLRQIGSQKQRSISQRDTRSHMLAESVDFECSPESDFEGTLKVGCYIRGQPLDVNGLVHIPGWGDFQMTQIDSAKDPHPLLSGSGRDEEMEECNVLAIASQNLQTSLEVENVPDPMEGEQTWPTEEEIKEAEAAMNEKRLKRKVPKGTSNYQAAWILDSDNDDYSEDEEDDEMDNMDYEAMDASDIDDDKEPDEDFDTVTVNEEGQIENYDDKINEEEESAMLEKFRLQRLDQMFPDEVDTPVDKNARTRFQKYRGLKSYNTTYWDPKENLPLDYARIFQFENFNRTRKNVLKQEREGALPGWYVNVHIKGVKRSQYDSLKHGVALAIIGLLPHEHKMSVMNVVVKRHPGFEQVVQSKERLIFQVSGRRFRVCPVFSSHTNGSKHKLERYLPEKGCVVATFYAPITFSPATVLVFKEELNGSHSLAAKGMVLSVNPDRIIVKRTVLSGHFFKINKRSAVVRYMFFNREDINWFKPVELRTKYGRRGHIKEPLGTHGHMKCVFDGTLKSEDTVLMNLYKRVFPKWNYDSYVPEPSNDNHAMED